MKFMRRFIALLFFFSGVAGLIYQLLWVRKFAYLLGSAYLTVSIIVASFMVGLLLGAWLIGKFMDHVKNSVRWYGALEIFTGLYAIFFVAVFHLFDLMFGGIASAFQNSELVRISFTSLFIVIILLPPTAAMGATLPLLVQHFTETISEFKINISFFYAINTFGAAVGVLIAGFYLIEKTGITNGILLTATLNTAIGVTALLISKKSEESGKKVQPASKNVKSRPGISSQKVKAQDSLHEISVRSLLIIAFCSGFISLSLEIIWTRALKFLVQSSTYSFSIILFVFLLGIAIGGRLAERWMKEKSNLVRWYGQLQMFLGVATVFTVYFLYRLAYTNFFQQQIFDIVFNYSFGWFSGILVYAFTCGLVFLLSTVLMGILFPILNGIYYEKAKEKPGKAVSRIYVINTAGSILGSLASGFILIPLIGIKWSLILLAASNMAIGFLFITKSKQKSIAAAIASSVIFLALLLVSIPADVLNSKEEVKSERVLYYNEGLSATVKVYEAKNSLNMSIDGMNIASTSPALLQKELLIAHLPFFIQPQIHDVLSVGLASGISTANIAEHQIVKKIDCVELNKPVFDAAKMFNDYNHDVERNSKVHLYHNDIYAFLKFSSAKYDLISSDGKLGTLDNANTTMLSADYYEQCKKHLNPGGIFIQWIPLITPSSCFNVILQTLKQSFNHVSIFYFYPSDVFMIGSDAPLALDLEQMNMVMLDKTVSVELSSIGFHKASELMCSYIGDYENLNSKVQVNTMNQPVLEFWFYRDWKKSNENEGGYRADNLSYLLNNFQGQQARALRTYGGLPNAQWSKGIYSSSLNFFSFCIDNFKNGSYESGKKEYDQFKKSIPF